jgi:hypothetical protein
MEIKKNFSVKATEKEITEIKKLLKIVRTNTGKPASDAIISSLNVYINELKKLQIQE